MSKLTLNSISPSVFRVNENEVADGSRADIVSKGRVLAYEHAVKGKLAMQSALNRNDGGVSRMLTNQQYTELNEKFQREHLLYAARKVCEQTGEVAPESFEDFKRNAAKYYGDPQFYRVLQGIYQEVITPILPAVYSEAVSVFADTVEVGFGETYSLTVGSGDIPIFQDSAWGAARSKPRNRFYDKTYTLNPKPRTAQIFAKYMQLIGNGMDFGKFFANIAAGMYAKTMGLWNAAMTAAASDTTLVPTGLTYVFNNQNWIALANKVSALNNTPISNVMAIGSAQALSKVLPTQVTGSTNVNMDAAIATLLGADYTRTGYLGEFLSVRLMPLQDVIVPVDMYSNPTTMLSTTNVWMLAGNGYKPMTIATNSGTPITLEISPEKSADFEIGINITMSIDSVAVFASKVGLIQV